MTIPRKCYKLKKHSLQRCVLWACSAAGSAFGSHPRGRGFESLQVHHKSPRNQCSVGFLQIKSMGAADGIQRLSLYAWRLQESPCPCSNSSRAQTYSIPIFVPVSIVYTGALSQLCLDIFRGIMSHPALPATCCKDACVQTAGIASELCLDGKVPAALTPLMKARKMPSFPAPGEAGCL